MLTELSTDVPIEGKSRPPIDAYEYHPLANKFPLLEGSEFTALVEDIRAHGLNEPIVLFEGKILDGRNRDRASREAGKEPGYRTIEFADHAAATAYVISASVHRRHLTSELKRTLIEELLKADPEQSDRKIAETIKVSDKTVGDVRRKAEARAEIPHVEKRKDSKGRAQPARKKSKSKKATVIIVPKRSPSEQALAEFKLAVLTYVSKMDAAFKQQAIEYLTEYVAECIKGNSK